MYRCAYSNKNKGPIKWVVYSSYSTGGKRFMGVSKQTLSSRYAVGLNPFTAINVWYCAITITKLLGTLGSKVEE